MAKPKKKKPNIRNLEKVAKAQYKNEFFRKLRKALDAIGCGAIYDLLSAVELEYIYSTRCQSINISVAENDFMPPGKLKWIKRLVSAMLKRYDVQLMPNGGSVDLDTFLTAGVTLVLYQRALEASHYRLALKVKEALSPFEQNKQSRLDAFGHLKHIALTTGLMMSDFTKRVYWSDTNLKVAQNDLNVGFQMVWHSIIPEKFYVQIKNETHLGFRVGLPEYQKGPKWISIRAGTQGLPAESADQDVEVYIQHHALRRLTERNDCVSRESILLELIRSLENPKMVYDEKSEKILIDFYLYNVKTGYLLAYCVGNKLLIRTFLFITHMGVPEGDKLRQQTGLKKKEIEFLELDKLSTFMTPEIQENKHIKHLFIEAGCRSLFSLYKILLQKNIKISKHPNTALLEDYLGLDLTKEYLEEDEEEIFMEEEFEEETPQTVEADEGSAEGNVPEQPPHINIWLKILGWIVIVIMAIPIVLWLIVKLTYKSYRKKRRNKKKGL